LKDLLKKLEEEKLKEIDNLKKKYLDKKNQLQKVIELKKS